MGSGRPTLKDVAERSGYALRTVKKVMSGDQSVREKTRESVLQAARELNYTRNLAASALGRNRTIRIALVYHVLLENAYYPEVEKGFIRCQEELRDYGLELVFCDTRGTSKLEQQKKVLEEIVERTDIDAVIMEGHSATSINDVIERLTKSGKPVVTLGSDVIGSSRLFHVGTDGYKSGRIAGQLLANYVGKKGRVYLFSGNSDNVQDSGRRNGFVGRLKEHYPNMEAVLVDVSSRDYRDAVREVVLRGDAAGIYCTDARTVIAGSVLKEMGIRDLPLVGFDLSEEGKELMRQGYIKVIIEQKPDWVSYLAAKRLFEWLAEKKQPQEVEHTPLYVLTSECL